MAQCTPKLTKPQAYAAEIAENLEAALDQFAVIYQDLGQA
jgi:hypothetical protein